MDWLSVPMLLIAASVFGLVCLCNEIGFRYGVRRHANEPESSRAVANTIKASIIGFVAFMLGFAFSISSGRHDIRRQVVLDEANAAGTLFLRAGFLGEVERESLREILRQYVEKKLELFNLGQDFRSASSLKQEISKQLILLWPVLERSQKADSQAVLVSQIVPAANEVIDLNSTHDWAFSSQTPVSVLLVLLISVLISASLIGHSFGQCGDRHIFLCLAFNLLFTLTLYLILDFDGPRYGLIRVDQTPLIECLETFQPQAK